MSAFDYYKNAFTEKYADFDGRARRSELWYFVLFHILAAIATMLVGSLISPDLPILYFLYILGSFIPALAVVVRRLHDTNRSGWWYLISLIPLIGSIVLLVFLVQDGDVGTNQYGLDPKNPSLAMEDDISRHLVD